jgi:hypothetical protein
MPPQTPSQAIATLEELSLQHCFHVTNVSSLSTSQSLKKLDLGYTLVTEAGIAAVAYIATLEECRSV